HEIFKRFARVFEQTYTRFLDLQKAEERAKEAQIETALEKVRSRTLAMQNSEEFAETSVVVFKQLLELGISPNRLFIGIIDPVGEVMDAWATNEDGTKLASKFQLKASENKSVSRMVDGWKQGKTSQVIDMMGEELKDYFQYLGMELRIPFQHGLDQKRRIQYLAYFSGGLIGMASGEAQNEQTLELLERFAAVFNLTYTRFKDLKVAEASAIKAEQDLEAIKAARENAEKALKELQQTQKQLIQSEKMASLGELTAGIAHEIQNPLNFVNNFSEVSNELLDEIFEEFENGNLDEVREILGDIKVNLDKINHHGKRADFIVKGMLQHSRKGNSQKESTNLNALCDEFLRLAYHGLRAKDKSFNASLETDFDPDLENIDIIAQDIGRVILNLLNNAFYAVLQKKNKIDETGYEPTVKISTRKKANHVQIKIEDNGDGIPDNILDKIFQPFFTTKPTGQGTGLGLSLSYDIVKAHGGDLEVTTQNGKGTTFTIIIKS
ncbi:MAG TPA: ATP-binding protein, partial [Christiangramia sp.]|nr:ATP-binding protein [Christiangramia sp.]